MKTQRINLAVQSYDERKCPQTYRVLSTQDTIAYSPGDIINRRCVEVLCANNGWKVRITSARDEGAES